jgi:hypothetical protein
LRIGVADLHPGRQQRGDARAHVPDIGVRRDADVDAVHPAQALQPPLRRGDVGKGDTLRGGFGREHADHAQRHCARAHLRGDAVALAQAQVVRGGAAQQQRIGFEQRLDPPEFAAEQRRLDAQGAKRIDRDQAQRPASGQAHVEFLRRARDLDPGQARAAGRGLVKLWAAADDWSRRPRGAASENSIAR